MKSILLKVEIGEQKISKWIAELYPENCIGLHLNLVPAFPPSNGNITDDLSEEEIKGLENFEKYQKTGLGYYQIQMTKPQSLGYALNDSPVGLAGWIVENFILGQMMILIG